MEFKELENIQKDYEKKLSLLKEDFNINVEKYINEHPIKEGDKVNVCNSNGEIYEVGIFGGFNQERFSIFSLPTPIVYKIKKDGNPSKHTVWTYCKVITKCSE